MLSVRRPDVATPDPLRNTLRGNTPGFPFPEGKDGFVVEDLDVVLRWHGARFGLDAVGRFRLLEVKHPGFALEPAQKMTFVRCMAEAITPERFDGIFLLQVDKRNTVTGLDGDDALHPDTTFRVVGRTERPVMSLAEFRDWTLTPVSPFEGLGRSRGQVRAA